MSQVKSLQVCNIVSEICSKQQCMRKQVLLIVLWAKTPRRWHVKRKADKGYYFRSIPHALLIACIAYWLRLANLQQIHLQISNNTKMTLICHVYKPANKVNWAPQIGVIPAFHFMKGFNTKDVRTCTFETTLFRLFPSMCRTLPGSPGFIPKTSRANDCGLFLSPTCKRGKHKFLFVANKYSVW